MNTTYDRKMEEYAYFLEGSYNGYIIEKAQWEKYSKSIEVYVSFSEPAPDEENILEDCFNIFDQIKYQDRIYFEPIINISVATEEVIDERKMLWTV